LSASLGLVLYGIAAARPRAELGVGMNGRALRIMRAGGAFVIVEQTSARAPEPSATKLRAHDRIVKRLAAATPALLPFRFGSLAADEAALRALLEPVSPAIGKALELVSECVQYTLRVYGHPAPSAGSSAASGPRRGKVGPGTKWFDQRLRARRVPEIAPMTAATAALVRSARVERHDRPPLVASVYHLVARRDAGRYRAALRRAAGELSGVEVRTTGPFPPYAFAELP
jgi:hypothetical protein